MDVGLSANASPAEDGWHLSIECKGFAQSVHVEAAGFVADDQYFHMAPHAKRTLRLKPRNSGAMSFEGTVHALNAATPSLIGLP